jgi:hypothetical protein
MPTLETKEKKRGRKDAFCLPEQGCLATYVGYVPCVNLSMLGVVSTPPQYKASYKPSLLSDGDGLDFTFPSDKHLSLAKPLDFSC